MIKGIKPRMLALIIILSALFAIALFTVLLMQRPGDDAADTGDELAVPADGVVPAEGVDIITDQRFIDGATVTLAYPLNLQFVTESERVFVSAPDPGPVGDAIVPETGEAQPVEEATQPAGDGAAQPGDGTLPADGTTVDVPTATPQTDGALGGVPATVNSGIEMITFIDYTVAPSDTMYSISTRRDTSMALMAMYGIDGNDMVAGRLLRLPIVNTAYCAGFRDYHLVVEGDNVYRIAQKFATTDVAIQRANALDASFMIKTNTVLCIP